MTISTQTLYRATRSPRTGSRARMHQADFVRGTTFLLVIFTHVLASTTNVTTSDASNVVAMLMHVSRNTFFFLTGFVLTYANFAKTDFTATGFWPRRLRLVLIPYVLWSFVYWVYRYCAEGRPAAIPFSLSDFWRDLSRGLAAPHLYFLFVMLQVYVLFPALLWLLRATAGHHRLMFACSAILQVAITSTLTYWHPSSGWLAAHWWQAFTTVIPYKLFILMGALVAIHRDEVADRLRGRGAWLAVAVAASGVVAVVSYLYRTHHGTPPLTSSDAFQPTLLPFLVAAAMGMYALALWWARRRRDSSSMTARLIDYTSNRSFGIFLSHMLIVDLLLQYTVGGQPWLTRGIPAPWATAMVYALVVPLTLALVEILRRLPGSIYLTGRPRLPLRGLVSYRAVNAEPLLATVSAATRRSP